MQPGLLTKAYNEVRWSERPLIASGSSRRKTMRVPAGLQAVLGGRGTRRGAGCRNQARHPLPTGAESSAGEADEWLLARAPGCRGGMGGSTCVVSDAVGCLCLTMKRL